MNAIRVKAALLLLMICLMLAACGGKTPAATDAPPTTISHTLIPVDLPAQRANHATDADSSTTAAQKQAGGGDRFTFGEFERPFNANTMDTYFPYYDIIDTRAFIDDTWVYAAILLEGRPDVKGIFRGTYGMELDTDRDGRGDWLVLVKDPASKDWSTQGVQVWQDKNHDVGGSRPMIAETTLASNDGYETLAFDSGNGADPDAAWARISPNDPNSIELAVKRTIIGSPKEFLVGMWAGAQLDPSKFDFNDHMTHTQAGAASRGYENFYPIKGLAEIDSSCRMPVGFVPSVSIPGLCPVFVPHVAGAPGAAGGCSVNGAICCAQGQFFSASTCSCFGQNKGCSGIPSFP